MKTIDCTPTWEGLLPAMLDAHERLTQPKKFTFDEDKNLTNLLTEFKRMAGAADKWNAAVKENRIIEKSI